jgi:hypothetical protein
MIRHISIIRAKIQNQMMYGMKLIANSAIKFSRKKYSNVVNIIDTRKRNNIQNLYLFKYV